MTSKHVLLIFAVAVLGTGVLVFFGLMSFDPPPPYVDRYDWKRNFPPDVSVAYRKDVVRVELWISQCKGYEEKGVSSSLIHARLEPYGTIFEMDCYGNVEWPHGQELGAMLLGEVLWQW